ncbi:MAG: tetratricopeptide repeat protein [Candidatus Omnitrophota bacterium]
MAENRIVILKRANKLFKQGKIDAAVKEFKKVLALKADDLEVRRFIGDLELKQNNISEAIEQFEWIADYYLKEGFFAKATAMYQRITRVDPNYEGALFKLADLYAKQGLVMEAKQIYMDIAESVKQTNPKKALNMYKKTLEFDKTNIKMRLLLAESYLKENLENDALNEYLTAADILMNKKEFKKSEEILLNALRSFKPLTLISKLLQLYTKQGDDDKAIDLLNNLGPDLYKNVDLMKILGELYFKTNQLAQAENIFVKIAEIAPEEVEIVLRLGKVYLQREEFEKAYNIFLPLIDKHIQNKKYEDAMSLLRLIIASNNSYIPALMKLASIFKASGKTNNLIALYESLIPIYEQKGATEELKHILEELVNISDKPFSYEAHLARLNGKPITETIEEDEQGTEREFEFIHFNLRKADEALRVNDFEKAIDILKKAKSTFPKNVEIRNKLFDAYQQMKEIEMAVEEGKALLELYKFLNLNDEYTQLLGKLSQLKPEDVKLVDLSVDEKTSIEIDFGKDEFLEEINASHPYEESDDSDILLLSEEDNIGEFPAEPLPLDSFDANEHTKSISADLSEVDFYLNDGYFKDAESLISKLKEKYPENQELLTKITKLEQARQTPLKNERTGDTTGRFEFQIESSSGEEFGKGEEPSPETSGPIIQDENENYEIDLGELETPPPPPLPPIEPDLELPESFPAFSAEDSSMLKISEEAYNSSDVFTLNLNDEEQADDTDSLFDLEPAIQLPEEVPSPPVAVEKNEAPVEDPVFEIELEEPPETKPFASVTASPPLPEAPKKAVDGYNSAEDLLDLDKIIMDEEPPHELDSPFRETNAPEMGFDDDDDLFKDEPLFIEESYLETEHNAPTELRAIESWMKELERQRTSTIEKNMMEIFEEFKKGVDEKIGQEDYDTRYNLGIAYKEMGLLEEAIHEFLISSKHPMKFFDSAGLLGMCFREKGMFGEAVSWFEKALETANRKKEEYLAVKYEMVLTLKLKEDYTTAKQILEEIIRVNPEYRNVINLYREIKALMAQQR